MNHPAIEAKAGYAEGTVGPGPGAYKVIVRYLDGPMHWTLNQARDIRDVLNALDLDGRE